MTVPEVGGGLRTGARPVVGAAARRTRSPLPVRQVTTGQLLLAYGDDPAPPRPDRIEDDGPSDATLPELRPADDLGSDEGETPAAGLLPAIPRPALSLWVGADGEIVWDVVMPPSRRSAEDPGAEVDLRRLLGGFATLLAAEYPAVVRARTRSEALLAAGNLTATDLADRVREYADGRVGDQTKLSHIGGWVVSLPCGLVTVSFLSWLGATGGPGTAPDFRAALRHAEVLARPARPRALDAAREVATELGVSHYVESLQRDIGPNLIAMLDRPVVVRSFQARLPVEDDDRFADALALRPSDRARGRGRWVRRLGLAGCLDHLLLPRLRAAFTELEATE